MRLPRFFTSSRGLWRFFVVEFFGSPPQVLFTIAATGGAASAYFGLTDLYGKLVEALVSDRGVALYLASTYIFTLVMFVGWVLLYRKIQIVLPRARKERNLVAKIQHRMAEIVRSAALRGHGGGLSELEKESEVVGLLEGLLPEYLELKLGRNDISIAVKYAVGSHDESGAEMQALFRHNAVQNPHQRKKRTALKDSVVFAKFQNAGREIQRIVVCDTKKLSTDPATVRAEDKARHETYRNYAKDCGFRSVLAFPLRAPVSDTDGPLKLNPFRGFISFDCPEPDAFEPLFDVSMMAPTDNDGTHYKDNDALHFFFGLADSLATLALLFDEDSANFPDRNHQVEYQDVATP